MIFEVFVAVNIQVEFFWVVILYSVVVGYQCFRRPYCLHLHSITAQKTSTQTCQYDNQTTNHMKMETEPISKISCISNIPQTMDNVQHVCSVYEGLQNHPWFDQTVQTSHSGWVTKKVSSLTLSM